MLDEFQTIVDSLLKMQQTLMVRVAKNEASYAMLEQMVFKLIADKHGVDVEEIASKHESLTHVSLMAIYDSIKLGAPNLTDLEVKKHLGLDD